MVLLILLLNLRRYLRQLAAGQLDCNEVDASAQNNLTVLFADAQFVNDIFI